MTVKALLCEESCSRTRAIILNYVEPGLFFWGGGVNDRQRRALKIRLIRLVEPLAELFPLVSFIASVLL